MEKVPLIRTHPTAYPKQRAPSKAAAAAACTMQPGEARSAGRRNLKVTPGGLLRCGQKASTHAHPQLFLHGIHGHAVLPWTHRAAPPPTLPALSPRDHTVLLPPVLHCAAMAGKPSCSLSASALPRKTFSSQFCTY